MKKTLPTLVLLLAALVACGGDSTAPKDPAIGTWVLTTIDDIDIPVTVTLADTTVEIVADTVDISNAGTYSSFVHEIVTIGTTTTPLSHASSGTWARTGTVYTFTDAADGTTVSGTFTANGAGSVSGNGSTVLGNTLTEGFRKL